MFKQVNLLQKGYADGPPYELRNADIIIILFLAPLLGPVAMTILSLS